MDTCQVCGHYLGSHGQVRHITTEACREATYLMQMQVGELQERGEVLEAENASLRASYHKEMLDVGDLPCL